MAIARLALAWLNDEDQSVVCAVDSISRLFITRHHRRSNSLILFKRSLARRSAFAFAIAADTPKGRFPANLLAVVEFWAIAQDDRVDPEGNCPNSLAC
jgi:hypothetical protein